MDGLIVLSLGQQLSARIIETLQGVPPWLIVFLIATLPIFELRGAIPIALLTFHMHWPEAVLVSIAGNMLPIPFMLWFLGPVSRFLSRWPLFDRFFQWVFARARRKSKAIERFEALGLVIFVGIPLPVTGGYTGSIAAYLFGIRFWRSMFFIFLGVCVAATVVTLATLGVLGVAGLFL